MPQLQNSQHELFAQNLVQGMSKVDAYEAAGYVRDPRNAHRAAKRAEVSKRIAELRRKSAERAVITAEKLIGLAEKARLLAMKNKQSSAAVSAIREMGVLAGVRVEKRETAARTLNDMSDDELADIARRGGDGE